MLANSIHALSLAKLITDELDIEQQIWLNKWFQQHFWRQEKDAKIVKRLNELHLQLVSYVQPRIAWEITLIELIRSFKSD